MTTTSLGIHPGSSSSGSDPGDHHGPPPDGSPESHESSVVQPGLAGTTGRTIDQRPVGHHIPDHDDDHVVNHCHRFSSANSVSQDPPPDGHQVISTTSLVINSSLIQSTIQPPSSSSAPINNQTTAPDNNSNRLVSVVPKGAGGGHDHQASPIMVQTAPSEEEGTRGREQEEEEEENDDVEMRMESSEEEGNSGQKVRSGETEQRALVSAVLSPDEYKIKWVKWKGSKTAIITQDGNGSCPLIAIMNVLFLKRKVEMPTGVEVVTASQLLDYLADALLNSVPGNLLSSDLSLQLNYEQNMMDAISILPKLQTGLDVNVKFSSISAFEYTPELIVFDLLQIPLYHGWLPDPESLELTSAVGNCSYNQLVDKIVTQKGQQGSLPSDHRTSDHASDDHAAAACNLAQEFLEATATQLTYHGLSELCSCLKDSDGPSVLFRNNHFITLFKYQNRLLQLVTDQGFLNEPKVVWETLDNIEGDGQFLDSDFEPVPPKAAVLMDDQGQEAPFLSPEEKKAQEEQDYLLALSLQEECKKDDDQMDQWEQFKSESGLEGLSDEELAKRLQAEWSEQQQLTAESAPYPPDQTTCGPGKKSALQSSSQKVLMTGLQDPSSSSFHPVVPPTTTGGLMGGHHQQHHQDNPHHLQSSSSRSLVSRHQEHLKHQQQQQPPLPPPADPTCGIRHPGKPAGRSSMDQYYSIRAGSGVSPAAPSVTFSLKGDKRSAASQLVSTPVAPSSSSSSSSHCHKTKSSQQQHQTPPADHHYQHYSFVHQRHSSTLASADSSSKSSGGGGGGSEGASTSRTTNPGSRTAVNISGDHHHHHQQGSATGSGARHSSSCRSSGHHPGHPSSSTSSNKSEKSNCLLM